MKNVLEYWKEFFAYFNALETWGATIRYVLLKAKGGGPNIFLTVDMLMFAFNVRARQTAQLSMAGRLKFS